MRKTRIGIAGYGNLGKGVESAIARNPDMELIAVFTRRDKSGINLSCESAMVYNINEALSMRDRIDVMILCGGSATDLPDQGPFFAAIFNTVDSFDTHAKIPQYYKTINDVAIKNSHVSVISAGWDPGLFSLNRLYAESILPNGTQHTFWGKGVSQGHSDAIRRIKGVKNAVQYTVPIDKAVEAIRTGANPNLTPREKHYRECFVVPEKDADKSKIIESIRNMPDYFADYDTDVHFITEEEFNSNHNNMSHGGFVFHTGKTGSRNHIIEYSLNLASNPEFTASVLVCYARAAWRLAQMGDKGAKTVFDIAPSLLSPENRDDLIARLL